jgi:hypothetical protein
MSGVDVRIVDLRRLCTVGDEMKPYSHFICDRLFIS